MHGSSKPKNVNQNEKHAGTVRHNTIGDKVGVFKTRIVKEESYTLKLTDSIWVLLLSKFCAIQSEL